MIVRKIPVGYYVKITPSNVDNARDILYEGHSHSNVWSRCFVERIKRLCQDMVTPMLEEKRMEYTLTVIQQMITNLIKL